MNIKKILLVSSLCTLAGCAFGADYKWNGTMSNWNTPDNWLVNNGTAEEPVWETATTAPGEGDSIVGNESVQQLAPTGPLVLGTFEMSSGTNWQVTPPASTAIDRIIVNSSNANGKLIFRGAGNVQAGTIETVNGHFGFGSGGNTIGGLTVSQGVTLTGGNIDIAVSTSALIDNVVRGDYSLGLVTFAGSGRSLNLAQTATLRGYNLEAFATVSGLVTNEGITNSKISAGATAVSSATQSASPGVNVSHLYIDVAAGQSYSANVSLQDTTQQDSILGDVGTKVNTLSLTKVGEGTQVLSATNSNYTGGTTISAGTLLVTNATGYSLGYGNAVVEAGGTLGGTGVVNLSTSNTLTVAADGTLLGGMGDAVSGTLTISSDVVMAEGSNIAIVLGASGAHSSIAFDGDLSAGNINLVIIDEGLSEGLYEGIITGLNVDPGVANWTVGGIDSEKWLAELSYNNGSVDLAVSAIPEPAAAFAIGALALLAVLRRRR